MQVEAINDHEWIIKESTKVRAAMDEIHHAEELRESGHIQAAISKLNTIIKEVPDAIEPYNDLYLFLLEEDHDAEAKERLESAAHHFYNLLPEQLRNEDGQRLNWEFLENRPFLRLYCNLGREYLDEKAFGLANAIFDQLLKWNPGDNQGVRELKVQCCFELDDMDEVLTIYRAYSDEELLASIIYAEPLALIRQGQTQKARKALKTAINTRPKVARKLLKKSCVKPKKFEPGLITVGGNDEAYVYRLDFGKYWRTTPGAMEMLKQVFEAYQVSSKYDTESLGNMD